MTPDAFYARIFRPAALVLAQDIPWDSAQSRCLLMAIAGQESAWSERSQLPSGRAHGFWQCEQGGAVHGVLGGSLAATLAAVCADYNIASDEATVWEAIQYHDVLAYAVARLTLRMDAPPLPAVGDTEGAWAAYQRVWGPGKPSRTRWATIYPQAVAEIA